MLPNGRSRDGLLTAVARTRFLQCCMDSCSSLRISGFHANVPSNRIPAGKPESFLIANLQTDAPGNGDRFQRKTWFWDASRHGNAMEGCGGGCTEGGGRWVAVSSRQNGATGSNKPT